MSISVIISQLMQGMLTTISIFALTLIFSMPLGFLVTACRMSKHQTLRAFTELYISIMRGTPLMLQLMVVYFFPWYLFRIHIGSGWRFPAIIIGFSINYAAYFAEIYRSGIEAIPRGQFEAAKMLRYSKAQTFFRIIFPQVFRIILPSLTNEVITLVKDTSLAFTLSCIEMFTVAKQIAAAETSLVPFAAAAAFYYIFNLLIALILGHVEKSLNYY